MVLAAERDEGRGFARRLSRWWRNWAHARAALTELQSCGPAEVERIARDAGVTSADLRILAGKWPDSAELLTQRMQQLRLDAADIARVEPQVIRDLQRVCTLCASKGKCEHDLARDRSDPVWQEYCPNAMTLAALLAERANRPGPKAAR